MAVNCTLLPDAVDGEAGVTVMLLKVAVLTIRLTETWNGPLFAVIVTEPVLLPGVARPVCKPMFAIEVSEDFQSTLVVRSISPPGCAVPGKNEAMALN